MHHNTAHRVTRVAGSGGRSPAAFRRRAAGITALLLSLCVGQVPGVAAAVIEYRARVDAAVTEMQVRTCLPAPAPGFLRTRNRSADGFLKEIRFDGGPATRVRTSAGRMLLPSGPEQRCVAYTVDLVAAGAGDRFPGTRRNLRGVRLLNVDTWLWLPPRAEDVNLVFELPADVSVSAPWPRMEASSGEAGFRLDGTTSRWPGLVAIGELHMETVALPGGELRLALAAGDPTADGAAVRAWVREGAIAVAGAYGRFPLSSTQVLVVPLGPADEPVPWGQVWRGGGPAVHLFIDQTRPPEEFREDWVLVHELSHLLHPDLESGAAWLYEGLASYYQNILRARAGMMSERDAWQRLHEGFERGRAQARPGLTLREASQTMRRDRLFMRVYWSGAAIALLADVEMRRRSASLDEALAAFRGCCLGDGQTWSSAAFLARLDRLVNTDAASPVAERYLDDDGFPHVRDLYSELGIRVSGGRVTLDDRASRAALRRAITGSSHGG